MKNENFEKIKDLSPSSLVNLLGSQRDVIQKYKSGYILPPLDKAILIEDEFGIPARAWVDLRKMKNENKK